ncbi:MULTISPECIES: hypothetical protein [Halobellus]|jgi:hypothetical protein|uniref:hypothetical protein n=1 Tax=Halobellus TaxID=1073986 RepID=UPI001314D230|nr:MULTISPECIES: hypothetical protein [Halobellus]MDQ2054359.1 hypothetical protein [Halobellus sp. H-GB7]
MTADETCETHAWASVGVVNREGSIGRVWKCERCPAWSVEPFDPDHETPWVDTWLAER